MYKIKTMCFILTAFVSTLFFCGCGDDDDKTPDVTITLSSQTLDIPLAGGTFEVNVSTNASEWSAKTQESWIELTASGTASQQGKITVKVGENKGEKRTGIITVQNTRTQTRKDITVTQEGVQKGPEPDNDIKCPIDGYTLAWNDEFDGTALNTSDWVYETGGHGWGNNEIQNYAANSKVATVSNGTLKINLFKEGGTVYSARIKARPSTGWKYGYVEARLKLPTGKGTWPAFWMMPSAGGTWPDNGEIDIMEEVGYQPNKIFSTIHCKRYNNTGTSIEGSNKTISTAQKEFHTYGMEWTADKMDFYIDGVKFFTYKNDGKGHDSWPFDAAFYPILNLAWGGNWGGAQGIDESCLPAVYEIDYVRIFQKK